MSPPTARRGRGRRPVDPDTPPGSTTPQIVSTLGAGQRDALTAEAEGRA